VTQTLELFDSILSLEVRIIACSDCTHGSRLVASITLGRIFEVRVRSSRTVDTDVSGHSDVRASVGFAHDSYYGDSTCRANGLTLENGH
jgi:hypothetical protein